MSVGGEVASRRGKEGDDDSWTDANFTGPKNEKKIHAINSAGTNGW